MLNYNIISADDHIQEAPDTFTKRVPAKLRERAPRIERGSDGGDAWVIDSKRGISFGAQIEGGRKFEEYRFQGLKYTDARPGAYDPIERLKDMDLDGVDAEVLYPNLLTIFLIDDFELQFACLRAYNDFLSEFCGTEPARLLGLALIPTEDPALAVEEIRRVARLKGVRGILLPTFPKGEPLNSANFEPMWAAAQDEGLPVHIHLRTGSRQTDALFSKSTKLFGNELAVLNLGALANYEALSRIIFGGILERYPKLKFVSTEGNIGWVPYFLERADRVYKRHRHWTKSDLPFPPSEYFHRQVLCTLVEDKVGVRVRDLVGIDNIMWSADYPHSDTTFPNSRQYIAEHFIGVPEGERQKIVCGNAAKLYGLT